MDSTDRPSIEYIKALVSLALDNDISLLEVGDVKIVPGPRKEAPKELGLLVEAEKRLGRPLTEGDKVDEVLFGPGGAVRLNDE